MSDPTNAVPSEGSSESGSPPAGPSRPSRRPFRPRRAAEVAVVVLALVAIAAVGVTRLHPAGDEFCDLVADLPALQTDAATPAPTLGAYADAMDAIARVAPDGAVSVAAGRLANHQRNLAAVIGAGPSSTDVLDEVATADSEELADARQRLDDAIGERCG